MKRCPTCSRIYPDPNQTVCVDDGTTLTDVDRDSLNAYDPPGTYVPPSPKQRRIWPWVVGIGGAFLLGVVALMIMAAIFVPRMARQPPAVATTDETNREENVDAPPPADEAQVLSQLMDIENEWTVANLNADKQKLNRILADDYVGADGRGGLQGKKEYLDTLERDTDTEKWEFKDQKVHLAGDRATLTGRVHFVIRGEQREFEFIDRFVWRNGRWQATGSELKRMNRAEEDVNNH
ncbi:MAG TPA: nuclear transport factor 2 family protein [Pyrinomonadaceae bacterium]|nr:nuclear transport factor 2 family protein [Pyrinomonadaceae bacterium]